MVAWVLRILVVLGLLGSAWIHFDLWQFQNMSEMAVIGPLFLVNVVAGVVIAVAVAVWRHWLPVLLAIGFGAVSLVALILSFQSGGFFGAKEVFSPSASDWSLLLWAVITEGVCVVFGIALLSMEARTRQAVRV